MGQPIDPRKPYTDLVAGICETDTAVVNDYHYYYDVLVDTDYIYTTIASGITQVNVTPDSPALLTFVDRASPEYWVKLTDLASAKEATLARKLRTINRAMNALENYEVISAINTAVVSQGNLVDLDSGTTSFNFKNLHDMIDQVIDYGSNYVLVAGTQIDKDIKLWDWKDNKYHSMVQAFKDLGISVQRINQTITLDGGSTSVLNLNTAYLVALDTEVQRPVLFVRKKLSDIDLLGGSILENAEKPERLVLVSPNPVTSTTTRHLGIGLTGYEQIVVAVTNPYGLSKFYRTV